MTRVPVVAVAIAGALLLAVAALAVALLEAADPGNASASETALGDIPADFLAAYQQAGVVYGIDWTVIAAIGKVETDHCRSQRPGSLPDTINSAGARGCTQFIGSTWRRGLCQTCIEPRNSPPAVDGYGYATDGDGDGHADPWAPTDAAASTARYLAALGAPDASWADVLYGYNHSTVYVNDVLAMARQYASPAASTPTAGGTLTLTTVDGITVNARIAGQLTAMLHAAQGDGITLTGNGHRDTTTQIALRRAHCGTSHYDIYQKPPAECRPPTARPGQSMHEQGLAIDFERCATRNTACWTWLNTHAGTYGFHNLPSEPWHWSTTGK